MNEKAQPAAPLAEELPVFERVKKIQKLLMEAERRLEALRKKGQGSP